MRVGIGYDSHRFSEERALILGGVEIPGCPGLSGHSDGDAVLHALIDALLGAAALGNIGELYPDQDPSLAGCDSSLLLEDTRKRLADAGFRLMNADITVVAEKPRIQDHVRAMISRMSSLLHVDEGCISVKGKTNEGMGWIGRGEGIAVIAVASVEASPRSGPGETTRVDA